MSAPCPPQVFWPTLTFAAGLFAAVALAPAAWEYLTLRHRYAAGQAELVALEARTLELEAVAEALADDPALAADLSSDGRRTGERLEVDVALVLAPAEPPPAPAAAAPPAWLEPLAAERSLRFGLLAGAAVLTIAAFTTRSGGTAGRAGRVRRAGGRVIAPLVRRYRNG